MISIATSENEEELVAKVKVLPKAAVEVMVRDFKIQNGLYKTKNEAKSLPGQDLAKLTMPWPMPSMCVCRKNER